MARLALSLTDIFLTFGGEPLFEGANLMVKTGARIALVGRNGSGKSTLLKIAAGKIDIDSGERFVDTGNTVHYLPQEPDASQYETVLSYVQSALRADDSTHHAEQFLDEVGVDPSSNPSTLSGGEFRKAAIARALVSTPDILLLDEPTNHLDILTIAWLEEKLKSLRAALVLISHDRRFLENVTNETVWIDRGSTRSLNRGFAHFEDWRDKILEEEELAQHKLGRKIAAEEDWVRYGVTARRKRNVRRLGELHAMRKELRDARGPQGAVNFSIGDTRQSGKQVILADGISKSFGDLEIIKEFSAKINRGDRIGIVGPNGAGKTTLLNLLTGVSAPDEGTVTLGANLDIVSLDQRRAALKPDTTLVDAITDGRGDWVSFGSERRHVASYLKDFLFDPDQWKSPVSALSGGERGRLALAAALARPSNLLILDEPTNDLDLETLELLEEMLSDYQGTLLLVSHDRAFVDSIVTSIITTDPADPKKWRRYVGGYDDMVAQRGAPPGVSPKPTRTSKPVESAPKSDKPQHKSVSKLSYKEKYALENLPAKIEALTQHASELKDKLAENGFFEKDPQAFNRAAADLEQAEADLAALEDEWLEIELKREAIENS